MNKKAECIRTVANWSTTDKAVAYDHTTFNGQKMLEMMPQASPKMVALFDKIKELDDEDMKSHGHKFKHMIFTDIKSSAYGGKLLAAAFKAKGFHPAFDGNFSLDLTAPNTFALLCSTTLYKKPLGVRFRKRILDIFNSRPDNVHGELIRFIILDQGFKEGIDLFDVKYVHLFEPLISVADEKQAIGRGTRLCGQKGLEFNPQLGWPLNVYRYEVGIPDDIQGKYKSTRMFEMFLHESGIDVRKLVFANTLEQICVMGAVDHDLTKNVHEFSIHEHDDVSSRGLRSLLGLITGGVRKNKRKRRHQDPTKRVNAPRGKKTFWQMREYIAERFSKYTWPKPTLENKCIDHGGTNIVAFNETQNFVRMYFQPHSSYKGLLLWHSVGTGKTCSAVATTSTSWERHGYNILWVTRHTLKPDIWKNMYKDVCSLVVRDKIRKGELPEDAIKAPMKYASKQWLQPISYKQFSNMLAGKNELYYEMVKRNGSEDILRKTFIIIDEAHKLFAADVTPSERPNVDLIYNTILNSYDKSEKDSARVLLMTATPYTSDPMHMIKLLNLMRPRREHIPEEFAVFASKYLDETGKFSKDGTLEFLNDITGYISYLNREKDARQFSYPVYENIIVPMTRSTKLRQEAEVKTLAREVDTIDKHILEGKDAIKKAKARVKEDTKKLVEECQQLATPRERKACKDEVNVRMSQFERELLGGLQTRMNEDNTRKQEMKERMRTLKREIKDVKSDFSQEAALISRCKMV
jgi:hypothetical protein